MRGTICFLVLCVANATAFAQTVAAPNTITLPPSSPLAKSPPSSAEGIKEIKERVAYWLKTCLEDWDAATHMTRQEWRTTCARVAAERQKFLLQNPDSWTMTSKRSQR